MAKREDYEVPPPLGHRFGCEECGGIHALVPCDNNGPEYSDWRFYYCGTQLRLAALNGFTFCNLEEP